MAKFYIRSNTFQIGNQIPVFPKKPDTTAKIICDITNDTAKAHTVRGEEKKERAGRLVYLSYETEHKPAHISRENTRRSSITTR